MSSDNTDQPLDRNGDSTRIDIDLGRLEEEAAGHSSQFREAARKAVDARADHAEAKAALEVVRAEVYLEALSNPLAFGIDGKATVSATEAAVTLDKRVRRAVKRMNDAKHLLDICEVDVSALEHRKRMLEKEAELWIAGYFSTPRPRGEAGERVKEATRKQAFRKKSS